MAFPPPAIESMDSSSTPFESTVRVSVFGAGMPGAGIPDSGSTRKSVESWRATPSISAESVARQTPAESNVTSFA
jgi:hypothetical protein